MTMLKPEPHRDVTSTVGKKNLATKEDHSNEKVADRSHGLRILTVVAFAFALVLAFLLKLVAEHWIPEGVFRTLTDHISIAMIVASILGITYDFVLDYQRDITINRIIGQFRHRFNDHQENILNYLQTYALFTPKEVFDLLQDIASQTSATPTLYYPAREDPKEYTFARSINYFDKLISVQRTETVEILREWIRKTQSPNVKFLASDFVGKYRLKELADDLYNEAFYRLRDDVPDNNKDRGWILNYIWAYSRCEDPMYETLKNLLCSTNEEWIQDWILTVPLQMPDRGFLEILDAYLDRGDKISLANRKRVLKAFAALQKYGKFDLTQTFRRFGGLFKDDTLLEEIDNAWRSEGLLPEPIKKAVREGQTSNP